MHLHGQNRMEAAGIESAANTSPWLYVAPLISTCQAVARNGALTVGERFGEKCSGVAIEVTA